MTILYEEPTLKTAIRSLCAENHSGEGVLIIGKEADLKDLSCLTIGDNISPSFTWSNVETELQQLQTEWTAQEYARNRQAEYPSIEDLVVALYDTDDKSAVEAKRASVKAKYPKPE